MTELLTVKNLAVTHKKSDSTLVSDVSFSLGAGQSLVILGQSGSGKTMTCHALMCLLDGTRFGVSGSVRYRGAELLTMKPRDARRLYGGEIVMIPQNPLTALNPSARIGAQMTETLALHAERRGDVKLRICEALERAGLAEPQRVFRSYPHMLSGGMLQRVTIAMALMANAGLIVADEPTTALDVVHRNATVEAFKALRDNGAGVLLVTHDFSVASQLGGELLVMQDSRVVESGAVDAILAAPQHEYTRALLDAHRLTKSTAETGGAQQC